MFEEPEESPAERAATPTQRAKEKADEFRMHAELCAVFEATRKFDAQIVGGLNADIARDVQRGIGKLEKSKLPDSPVLPETSAADAAALLNRFAEDNLSPNDYHIHRRPGEVMMVRWIEGEQVDSFYERLQAHFDAALNQCRDEERQSHGWKQDAPTLAYLDALDAVTINMAERYLREIVRKHSASALSTQTADEMDILHLGSIMNAEPSELVGGTSAPGDEPTEQDRTWFFKLFSLRGMNEGKERMCFFAYLQKVDEGF